MIRSLFLVVLVAAGCAHVEAPRGGPEELPAPRLVATMPDSGVVVPGLEGPARFDFQHRISERGLEDLVRVSPRTSTVRVDRHLGQVRVRPSRGWEAGLVYQVTILPGLRDRWDGTMEDTVRLVFSTGPEIPDTRVDGIVLDRITGQPVENARIELIDQPDSVVYETYSGPGGEFTLWHVPPTLLSLRAYEDLDRSMSLQDYEPRDTTTIDLAAEPAPSVTLRLLDPDTIPPAMDSVRWREGRAEAYFDRYLDETQSFGMDQSMLRDAAGRIVPVERLAVSTADEPEPGPDIGDPDAGEMADAPLARRDDMDDPEPTVAPEEVDAPGPLPSRVLHIYPRDPLPPGEYLLRIDDVVSVHGLVGGGEGMFEVVEAERDEADDEIEEGTDDVVEEPEIPSTDDSTPDQ